MKKTTFAITLLSLVMICSTMGLSQGKAKARVKPPVRGGQICTGCCDPCYADDVAKIRQPQTSASNARTAKPKKGKR